VTQVWSYKLQNRQANCGAADCAPPCATIAHHI